MTSHDGNLWTATLPVDAAAKDFSHCYRVVGGDGKTVRKEEGAVRCLHFAECRSLSFSDVWLERPFEAAFLHGSFARTLSGEAVENVWEENALTFYLQAPIPPKGYFWSLVGNLECCGGWNPQRALPLRSAGDNLWTVTIPRSEVQVPLEYKYILSAEDNGAPVWEEGENRELRLPYDSQMCVVRTDGMPKVSRLWRGAGVVIPVFSLRSKGSQGIGDFGDLQKMITWAASEGMNAVQLLPINDTSATGTHSDSYPYNSLSVFALHPNYLDLREWQDAEFYGEYASEFERLNALPALDYASVYQLKRRFTQCLFAEIGTPTMASAAFADFCSEHHKWLVPYALFCHLRDKYGTANFRDWQQFSSYDERATTDYLAADTEARQAVDYYQFLQFLLFRQLIRVHAFAREKHVLLKGDLPIGISRDSVPAWADHRLFHFDGQAGAPPDAFSVNGQNWGFPTYDWEEMAKDDYAWWKERLHVMSLFFDAYRIDHVLGFFRIWEIPVTQVNGLLGVFRPAKGYTEDELRHFGFTSSAAHYSVAHLSASRLQSLQSEISHTDLYAFFEQRGEDFYLRPEVNTERKIRQEVQDEAVRKILMSVVGEVLFIRDVQDDRLFHPRIAANETYLFKSLSAEEQSAFHQLHNHYFYVRHNDFWAQEALRKLTPLVGTTTPMLPCAEDLGMVPASVKGVLEQLRVLSLEIQRMPKQYGVRFDDLSKNPYYSVSTIATHDMAPLRLWWEENAGQTQAFWTEVLRRGGVAPAEADCDTCEAVVSAHLDGPSMLCLLALQDWLSVSRELRADNVASEQINVPANPHHYWGYRMHLTMEELQGNTQFNEKIRNLIARSGR